MFLSYCTLHPASHKTLIEIMDACDRHVTMCASVAVSGMPSIYRFHVCVDLSLDLYGRLI